MWKIGSFKLGPDPKSMSGPQKTLAQMIFPLPTGDSFLASRSMVSVSHAWSLKEKNRKALEKITSSPRLHCFQNVEDSIDIWLGSGYRYAWNIELFESYIMKCPVFIVKGQLWGRGKAVGRKAKTSKKVKKYSGFLISSQRIRLEHSKKIVLKERFR